MAIFETAAAIGSVAVPIAETAVGIFGRKKQNEENRENARVAFERQRQLINEANIYNSPVEQMKRLNDAGLNPHLIYGNGAGGMVSASAGTPPAPQSVNEFENIGIYSTLQQIKLAKEQIRLQDRKLDLEERELPSIIAKNYASVDESHSNIDRNNQTMLGMMQDREIKSQLLELQKNSISLENQMKQFSLEQQKELAPLIKLNHTLQNEQIMNNIRISNIQVYLQQLMTNSNISVNNATIDKINSDTALNNQEKEFLDSVNGFRVLQEQYNSGKARFYDTRSEFAKNLVDGIGAVFERLGSFIPKL